MNKHLSRLYFTYALIATFGVCALSTPSFAGDVPRIPQWGPDQFGGYASHQIIVELPAGLAKAITQRLQKKGASLKTRSASLPDVKRVVSRGLGATMSRWGVTNIRPVYSFEFKHPELAVQYGLNRLFIVDVPLGTDTPNMVHAFAAHKSEISSAGLDSIGGVGGSQLIPNDVDFNKQYGMHNTGQTFGTVDADIDAPEAWTIETGFSNEVIIAIVDSGVDKDDYNGSRVSSYHPEFAGRMVPGFNTVFNQPDDATGDECFHGTHVAGIAAASGNTSDNLVCVGGDNDGLSCVDNNDCPNSGCVGSTCQGGEYDGLGCNDDSQCPGSGCKGIGVAGVSWGAKIMPVDVLGGLFFDGRWDQCAGTATDISNGIIWAADHGADIINISLQAYPNDNLTISLYENAINFAYNLDATVVCASGNFFGNIVAYPARLPNCLAVGATDKNDDHPTFSNWGDELDLTAPGASIWSTWPSSSYTTLNGTSMATPHVSGLAALMKSLVPDATNDEIMQVMKDTADDLGLPGWDDKFGHGRINAFSALIGISTLPKIIGSVPPDGAIDARKPQDANGSNRIGWDSVDLTFPGDVSVLSPEEFETRNIGGPAVAPPVLRLDIVEPNVIRVVFDDYIGVDGWTQITHLPSSTKVRIGHLPGDVDGDGMNTVNDLFELTASINGTAKPRELWSIDLDRSGQVHPGDLTTLIDLFNGADTFEIWLGETIPALPSP